MKGEDSKTASRVAMLYTRFPVASETFLQREAIALRKVGLDFDILSLWPAPGGVRSKVRADFVFQPWQLPALLFWIPYWLCKNPKGMTCIVEALVWAPRTNFLNFWETMLGIGYAIIHAREFSRKYAHLHAVWSSAPGTAAWAISRLTKLSYSMAGHAYDLFEDGGDCLLPVKIPEASFLRTSTEAGQQRWIDLGAKPEHVQVIRRGLTHLPEFNSERNLQSPLRILSVGRVVEKMGFELLLEVLVELKKSGCSFQATLIGGGPLLARITRKALNLGLSEQVTFTGALPYPDVEPFYRQADIYLFTGKIAKNGDRAGFPNVIGEAMAWGVPVCATPVGAVSEGIRNGQTGLIFQKPQEAAIGIRALCASADHYLAIRKAARDWVEANFDAELNMQEFKKLISSAT